MYKRVREILGNWAYKNLLCIKSPPPLSSIKLFFCGNCSSTDVTSFCKQFEKRGRGLLREAFWSEGECVVYSNFFLPPHFKQTTHSPLLRKASRINPCPLFSNWMQNDVMSVCHYWSSLRKKNNCILLSPSLPHFFPIAFQLNLPKTIEISNWIRFTGLTWTSLGFWILLI